jgi:hypothetical protein
MKGMQVPYAKTAKYLGMTLDAKLRWNVMFSSSSSGKCIGYLDAILSCQSTINPHYASRYTSRLELWYPVLGLR